MINNKYCAILLVVILTITAGIILFTREISTQPTQPSINQPDLSKIKIYVFENYNTTFLNYYLDYKILEEKDICAIFQYEVKAGDGGIVIRGTLKNEYDKDYYIFLSAEAYDSNGNLIGRSLDSGPICGTIAPYIKSNKAENFELHLKFNNTISQINLRSGGVSEIAPP